jgi:hypothetical protein
MRGGLQGSPYMIRQHAMNVLRSLFPRSTPAEIDRFTFYFLISFVASVGKQMGYAGKKSMTLREADAERDRFAELMHSLSDLNDHDLRQLQSMMDQKSKLETKISNVMRAAAITQSSLAGNLKGS